uniref:glutathione transferase n=1 Tax=Cathaya argyrophylla TaxID=64686 RepID=B8YDC4_CATAR|nr:phi class glutathione transferase [Cathaya argyrophylla]ACL37470.1 phi class glutathione transferase [Cathaya argyrophylla]
MATITLYGHNLSSPTKMVLSCLEEKQLDYEIVIVDLSAGAQKEPQYLALNPFGLIPTIQDGDLTLFESRAMIRYLAKKYKGQGTELLGKTVLEQAVVDQWCEVEGQSFNSPASTIVAQTIFVPMRGGTTDEAAVEVNVEKLKKVLDIYEERLSKSKYLAGDFFSLADLQHLPSTDNLVNTCGKGDLILSRKHVKAWWEDISSRPAWKKVKKVTEKGPK